MMLKMTSIALPGPLHGEKTDRLRLYFLLFFISGFPALLYQIVWQRALFTIYGVNIQSVTVIVTVFMLGLGLGSLAGGRLSAAPRVNCLRAFGLAESSVGIFGLGSLALFHRVAQYTAGQSTTITGLTTFLLLLVPTLLMGSTLPLLVSYFVRRTANVGDSVGLLYAVNTFGSGVACFAAAIFLMRTLGESGTVRLAAALNLAVGITALLLQSRAESGARGRFANHPSGVTASFPTIPFGAGMLLAAMSGFVALAYEIVWYRIYAFVSQTTAGCFARLLAFYLFGIAYGAFAVHEACKHKLRRDLGLTLRVGSIVVMLGAVSAYLVAPGVSFAVRWIPYDVTFTFVSIAAALLGAAFPLISHAAIGPAEQAGKKLGYLYLSNIIGSTLGSFLVGFVVLNYWSTGATSLLLLGLGLAVAILFAVFAKPRPFPSILAAGIVVGVILAALNGPLFSTMYERLLWKSAYRPGMVFRNLVENRNGAIAVDSDETVYGDGAYDGHFNIDPMHDTNGIFRIYILAALHPHLKSILEVGLSSGSWAQIVANYPGIESETVVEINPGYLPLIRQRPAFATLLQDPKVHIYIDDGRRWLVSHPHRKFDFILMNTTFNWRANASNLLSDEFLKLAREHLNPGGVLYYNTTDSGRVQLTGATVFPYALRISNFLAVSDAPIVFDRARLGSTLSAYKINGRPVFDPKNPRDVAQLDAIVSVPFVNRVDADDPSSSASLQNRTDLLAQWKGRRLITDNNMGTEWSAGVER
jgi:spermidine synthase